MKIDENPKETVAPDINDVSDNLDNDGIDEEVEIKLDNDEEMVEYIEDEESDEELTAQTEIKSISLHDAKKAAVDLHNFVLCNLDQRIEKYTKHQAYKVREVVCKMVRAFTIEQKNANDFFTSQNQSSTEKLLEE